MQRSARLAPHRPGRRRRLAAAAALLAVAGCDDVKQVADPQFTPVVDGVLTVATTLPAPGFWEGADAASMSGGYEWAIAEALAEEYELRLEVVDVPFDQIAEGDLADVDLAIAQISITDQRAERMDFSFAYYDTDTGVVGPVGEELTDLKTAKEQRWGVLGDTTHEAFIEDVIKPDQPPEIFTDNMAVAQAVADGEVDAGLFDLATALLLTNVGGGIETIAKFDTDERYGIALPKDSENLEIVDASVRRLEADGSLDDFADEWLGPVFEKDPADIHVIIADQ